MDSSLEVSEELLTLLSIQSKMRKFSRKHSGENSKNLYESVVLLLGYLSHSEDKREGIPIAIEYISLNNSSYKYQACKIQSMNPYIFF